MTWFRQLMGFDESTPNAVRQQLEISGDQLISRVNGNGYRFGRLEILALTELRDRADGMAGGLGKISVREMVADVQKLQVDPANAGAFFQVASQFNLLEMMGPERTPEEGVGIYQFDRTQGPACAIACGAGTIYRNYLVPVNGRIGQSSDHQIDCLAGIGCKLGNENNRLWQMQNGYALPSQSGIEEISKRLLAASEPELDELRGLLQIGVHWNTQVTLDNCQHLLTQAYCSALPVSYTTLSTTLWAPFAKLVLEASYEATLCAAVLNAKATGNRRVYLTMIGGGAFGNEPRWIIAAMKRALDLFRTTDLDVVIVSYGGSNGYVRNLASMYSP